MAIQLKRFGGLLLAGGLSVGPVLSGNVLAQHGGYNPDLRAIQQQIEQQQNEIQALRARLQAVENGEVSPLPPTGIQTTVDGMYPVMQDDGKSEKKEKSLGDRVKDLEKAAKKASDEAKKKKAQEVTKPSHKLRGRVHADAVTFDQDAVSRALVNTIDGAGNGDLQDFAGFRRARIGVDGQMFEVSNYRIEMDFAGSGRPTFTDVYWGIQELPYVNNVRAGHFKEPFSLEQLTSSLYVTFMERSLADALVPARNWGVSTFDYFEGEWGTWATGVFRTGSDDFGDDIGDAGEWSWTSRLTAVPYYDEPSEGRYLLHLGGAYSYRDPDSPNPILGNGTVNFGSRPEIAAREDGQLGNTPNFVATGNILANDFQLYGAEAAWVYGPFSLQSEWISAFVDPTVPIAGEDELYFNGAYIQASYFLTGESRTYNRTIGAFDRQKVYEPFFCVCTPEGICKGSGAWEVAVRWSYLDLDDAAITGGYLDDVTVGMNWYLNPYMRVMFNYIHADLNRVAGEADTDIYAMRFDVHF